MWIDEHPYATIYLVGCGFVLLLSVFNMSIFWSIAWFTKANIVAKNLKKLQPPDDDSKWLKAAAFVAMLTIDVALSWIGVVAAIWKTLKTLLEVLRDAFVSVPESVRALRFALRSNPNMKREVVWAYVQALRIRVGEMQPEEHQLIGSLESLRHDYPSIDAVTALRQLSTLDVAPSEVIALLMQRVTSRRYEDASITDDDV